MTEPMHDHQSAKLQIQDYSQVGYQCLVHPLGSMDAMQELLMCKTRLVLTPGIGSSYIGSDRSTIARPAHTLGRLQRAKYNLKISHFDICESLMYSNLVLVHMRSILTAALHPVQPL
jgi:hypothetical protein